MSKNVNFEIGTIVTDTFLDGLQELLTGTIQNFRLGAGSSTSKLALELNGDTLYDNLGAVNIQGRHCYSSSSKESNAASGTASLNIYLSTSDSGGSSDPDFSLNIGSTAAGLGTYIRKIGTVTSTAGILSNAKMITGVQADHEQYNSFTFKSILNTTGEVLLLLAGQSAQISTSGTYDSSVSGSPTKALSVTQPSGEKLYIDTAGRVVFGGDTALQRSTHGVNAILTANKEFSSHIAGANQPSFSARAIDTDNENRITIENTGEVKWGSGTAAADVTLYRSAANILSLGAGDKIQQSEAPTAGDDLANKTYVDSVVGGGPEASLNLTAEFLQNGTAPVVGSLYELDSPNDSVLLCKTSVGDLSIRLTNKLNKDAVGGNPIEDGDVIFVKDSDGNANINDLVLVAEGVRKQNVPLLQATSVTGTIADTTSLTTSGGIGVDEVQSFSVTGVGTFKVTFDGQEAAAVLSETSTGADVVTAINSLSPHPNYGYFSVSTTTPASVVTAGVTITFDGGALIDGEASYQLGIWESAKAIYKNTAPYGEWFIL